jgi:transcription elongation GreA/GreB family factor
VHSVGDPASPITDVWDLEEQRCIELVHAGPGADEVAVEMEDVTRWQAMADVAARFQVGRIFLAGGAARVMPTYGGYGGNTGIHDVHNLAWKLAAVLSGQASPGLLPTYDRERRPVARFTADRPTRATSAARRPTWRRTAWSPAGDLEVDLGACVHGRSSPKRRRGRGRRPARVARAPQDRATHLWVEHNGQRVPTLDLAGGASSSSPARRRTPGAPPPAPSSSYTAWGARRPPQSRRRVQWTPTGARRVALHSRKKWGSDPMGFASDRGHDGAMTYESTQTRPRPSVGILLTRTGLRTREQELDQLRAAKRDDIGRRLREARGYGEPAGNDEYLATREDEAIIDARIAALETMLAQASVVPHRGHPGVVGIGSVVSVDEPNGGASARYRLVGSHEAQAPGDASISSPVGQALLGRRAGDTVTVRLPDGRTRRLRIASVAPPT